MQMVQIETGMLLLTSFQNVELSFIETYSRESLDRPNVRRTTCISTKRMRKKSLFRESWII